MKNLENFGVQEMDAREIKETDGGLFFGTSGGFNWANFWRGVTIGAGAGGAGAAAYYSYA